MGYCSSCGSPVPDGQNSCSMCYGDPAYGRDGHYQNWLEEQWAEEEERHMEEQAFQRQEEREIR